MPLSNTSYLCPPPVGVARNMMGGAPNIKVLKGGGHIELGAGVRPLVRPKTLTKKLKVGHNL